MGVRMDARRSREWKPGIDMAQPSVAREPSMEEILASIRRIIESNETGPTGAFSGQLPPVYDDEDDGAGEASFVTEAISPPARVPQPQTRHLAQGRCRIFPRPPKSRRQNSRKSRPRKACRLPMSPRAFALPPTATLPWGRRHLLPRRSVSPRRRPRPLIPPAYRSLRLRNGMNALRRSADGCAAAAGGRCREHQ